MTVRNNRGKGKKYEWPLRGDNKGVNVRLLILSGVMFIRPKSVAP